MKIQEEFFTAFSRSELWQLQRRYFLEQGPKAWQEGEVPHYVTSNPAMARMYAETVFGFFRDIAALHPGTDEKIYILELGGATGRFSFQFLKCLERLCAQAAFDVPAFCYVISDFVPVNVAYCRAHDHLQEFVEKGVLDFACFDADSDDTIRLLHADTCIVAGSLHLPLVIIGNYFFDGIPQDIFYVKDKTLYEAKVAFGHGDADERPPQELLRETRVDHRTERVQFPYYPENEFDTLLKNYTEQLTAGYFLFPGGAIRCLERLRKLSQQGFFLLSADKGECDTAALDGSPFPGITRHGSVSLNVNYHALTAFYEMREMTVLLPAALHESLAIVGILAVTGLSGKETSQAFRRMEEYASPDDFFRIKKQFEVHLGSMELYQLYSYLRFSGYDARLFNQCVSRLLELLPEATAAEKNEAVSLIRKVWENYFPIGERTDLPFEMGILLCSMEQYAEALVFFQHSITLFGEGPTQYYNIAACYYSLEDNEQAARYLEKTLQLDPAHEGATALQEELPSLKKDVRRET